jgi:hypothetical protein
VSRLQRAWLSGWVANPPAPSWGHWAWGYDHPSHPPHQGRHRAFYKAGPSSHPSEVAGLEFHSTIHSTNLDAQSLWGASFAGAGGLFRSRPIRVWPRSRVDKRSDVQKGRLMWRKPVESIGTYRRHCPGSTCEEASLHANHARLVEHSLRRQFLGPWPFAGETQPTRSSDCCVRPEYLSGGACFPERGGSRRGVLHATVAAAITHDRLQNSVRHEIFWPMVRHCCGAHGPLLSLWLSAMSVCSSLLDCMCWQPACSTRFVCRPTAASVFSGPVTTKTHQVQARETGVAFRQHRGGRTVAESATARMRPGWKEWHFVCPGEVARGRSRGGWHFASPGDAAKRPNPQQSARGQSGRSAGGRTVAESATARARARAGPH